jgi:hypothetical protein
LLVCASSLSAWPQTWKDPETGLSVACKDPQTGQSVPCDPARPRPPIRQSRFESLTAQYQDLLRTLWDDVPAIHDLSHSATTEEGLVGLVDRLHWRTSVRLGELQDALSVNARLLAGDQDTLSRARATRRELKAALASTAERLRGAGVRRDEAVEEAKVREEAVRQLGLASQRMANAETAAAKALVYWLAPLLPQAEREELAGATEYRVRGSLEPFRRSQPSAVTLPPETVSAALPPYAVISGQDPPQGTIETKLAAVGALAKPILELAPIVAGQFAELKALRAEIKATESGNTALERKLEPTQAAIAKAETETEAAELKGADADFNAAAVARTALQYAAFAWAWESVKNNVVIPEVKQVLSGAGWPRLTLTDDGMRNLLERLRQGRQLELTVPEANLIRLVRTEKKVYELIRLFQEDSLAAADALGRGTVAQAEAVAAQLCADTNAHGIDIMRRASGTLPGAWGNMAKRLMAAAACK